MVPSGLPVLMTTGEVARLLRISVRTFRRRREAGAFTLAPAGRGRELLWRRDDVLAIIGNAVLPEPRPEPQWAPVSRDALKRYMAEEKAKRRRGA